MLQPGCEFGVLSQKFLCGHGCEDVDADWSSCKSIVFVLGCVLKGKRKERAREAKKTERSNACNKPQHARMIAIPFCIISEFMFSPSVGLVCPSHPIPYHSISSITFITSYTTDEACRHRCSSSASHSKCCCSPPSELLTCCFFLFLAVQRSNPFPSFSLFF